MSSTLNSRKGQGSLTDPVELAKAGQTKPTPGAPVPSRVGPPAPAPEGLQGEPEKPPPPPKAPTPPAVPPEIYVVGNTRLRVSLFGQVIIFKQGQEVDAAGY